MSGSDKELIEKLKGFAFLKKGWLNGEGGAISERTIHQAIEFITKFPDMFYDCSPGGDRQIILLGAVDNIEIEIKIRKKNNVLSRY
jgi:hypothetical protein